MTAPFFSIVTRHLPERASVLARNQASLATQTFQDFEQIILQDDKHVGSAQANTFLQTVAPRVAYVWVVDDDDFLADERVLEDVHTFLVSHEFPPFLIVKVEHRWAILPEPLYWGAEPPPLNHIGSSGVVTRRDVWMQKREHWTNDSGGDYVFIASLCETYPLTWFDRLTVKALVQGFGERKVE